MSGPVPDSPSPRQHVVTEDLAAGDASKSDEALSLCEPIRGAVPHRIRHLVARRLSRADRLREPLKFLLGSNERPLARIYRPSDVGVVRVTRKQMEVQVRKRVAVDLVVHLDRRHGTIHGCSDHHRLLPEPALVIGRHLERLVVMTLCNHADISRKCALSRRGCPTCAELSDDVEGLPRLADDATLRCPSGCPLFGPRPNRAAGRAKISLPSHGEESVTGPAFGATPRGGAVRDAPASDATIAGHEARPRRPYLAERNAGIQSW